LPVPVLTQEQRAAGGRKSAAIRARRKAPDARAREALASGAAEAAKALVSIIRGDDGFEEVKPELKFKAALVVLEYTLGKPAGLVQEEDEKPAAGPTFEDLLRDN